MDSRPQGIESSLQICWGLVAANPDGYDVYAPAQHSKRILALMASLEVNKWAHVMHDAGGRLDLGVG